MTRIYAWGISTCNQRACGSGQVWAHPTTLMQCDWLGERVATVDINRAITNVIENREDAGWGPNAVFRFPLEGGTGAIWKAVAKRLPSNKQVIPNLQIRATYGRAVKRRQNGVSGNLHCNMGAATLQQLLSLCKNVKRIGLRLHAVTLGIHASTIRNTCGAAASEGCASCYATLCLLIRWHQRFLLRSWVGC